MADMLERMVDTALPTSESGPARSAMQVVVVLGYRLEDNGSPTALLAQRVAVAAALASRPDLRRGAWLLFSGGTPPRFRNVSEAMAMRSYFSRCSAATSRHAWGEPVAEHHKRRKAAPMVLLENRSRSTRENAVESVSLILRELPRSGHVALTVVSNAFHQPRACRTFANAAAAADDGVAATRRARGPRIDVHCASVPRSTRGAYDTWYEGGGASDSALATSDGTHAHRRRAASTAVKQDSAWCEARSRAPDPREVVALALREVPALLLYAWRGWL
jgi:uncharacterized SAM-binding protein YcdF (DUF218 family)